EDSLNKIVASSLFIGIIFFKYCEICFEYSVKKNKNIKIKNISAINFALFLPKYALKDTSCCTNFPISNLEVILSIKSFKKLNSFNKLKKDIFISFKLFTKVT